MGRKSKRTRLHAVPRKRDYWCLPQKGGHPTLYFHGHELISRADYVGAVGPGDCDPHITTSRAAKRAIQKRGATRKRGPRTQREQMKRM
jgi:hypothetical protein